jgi:hypothetical protein
LVGDAAHGVHPIAGQGLNLGLRDVGALAQVLVEAHRRGEDIGAPDVLERYQRWRRFDSTALALEAENTAKTFLAGESLTLEVDGAMVTILPEEVEVRVQAKTGYAVAAEGAAGLETNAAWPGVTAGKAADTAAGRAAAAGAAARKRDKTNDCARAAAGTAFSVTVTRSTCTVMCALGPRGFKAVSSASRV